MSQILAQHHLPDAPEPEGRIPTIAPMELTEQDTKTLSPTCSQGTMLPEPRGKDPALPLSHPRSQTSQGGARFPLFLQHQ